MKTLNRILCGVALLASMSGGAFAQVHVDGYTRSDGTYVAPHYRSAPDGNVFNNYSTQGNTNPYTGQPGTVNPYAPSRSPYGSSYSNPYGSTTTP
jgi:hypothetical protein